MIPSEEKSRELDPTQALALARQILAEQANFWSGYFAHEQANKLDADFYTLHLFTKQDRLSALQTALGELSVADSRGPSPPNDVSSHPPHRGLKLYAFVWQSQEFECKMYLKFAIATKGGTPRLVLYSFHASKHQ